MVKELLDCLQSQYLLFLVVIPDSLVDFSILWNQLVNIYIFRKLIIEIPELPFEFFSKTVSELSLHHLYVHFIIDIFDFMTDKLAFGDNGHHWMDHLIGWLIAHILQNPYLLQHWSTPVQF